MVGEGILKAMRRAQWLATPILALVSRCFLWRPRPESNRRPRICNPAFLVTFHCLADSVTQACHFARCALLLRESLCSNLGMSDWQKKVNRHVVKAGPLETLAWGLAAALALFLLAGLSGIYDHSVDQDERVRMEYRPPAGDRPW